jgi:hypothetical protein
MKFWEEAGGHGPHRSDICNLGWCQRPICLSPPSCLVQHLLCPWYKEGKLKPREGWELACGCSVSQGLTGHCFILSLSLGGLERYQRLGCPLSQFLVPRTGQGTHGRSKHWRSRACGPGLRAQHFPFCMISSGEDP